MTLIWQHLDADGKEIEEGAVYVWRSIDWNITVEGEVRWAEKYGYLIEYTTQKGIYVSKNRTILPYEQKRGRVFVYSGLRRKEIPHED